MVVGTPVVNALEELHYALETMQSSYFQLWLGTWPESIDWTGAVLGTLMSASLYSLTRSLEYLLPIHTNCQARAQDSLWSKSWSYILSGWDTDNGRMLAEGQRVENEINKYFSQIVAYYFGENAFAIRLEAFDDMLWVVLGLAREH